jgi:hypothetical protein
MRFMVIERFKERDAPAGLRHVGSRIEASFERCSRLMERDDARRLQRVAFRTDLLGFEIVPLVPSDPRDARAAARTTRSGKAPPPALNPDR